MQLPTGGKPLTVTIGGRVEAKKRKYTAENLLKLQASCNFSDKDKAIAGATLVVFGRDSVIKNLPEEMKTRNHFFDGHFKKVDLNLKFKPPKNNSEDSDSEQEESNVEVDKDGCIKRN